MAAAALFTLSRPIHSNETGNIRMKVFSKTDMGMVRTSNQDALSSGILAENAAYGVVCDGMGGVNGGQIASGATVECFEKRLRKEYKPSLSDDDCERLLLDALRDANEAVLKISQKDKNLSGMGTTCVAALLSNGILRLINVGDSRAYIYTGGSLTQLTKDHSMVQHLIDIGQISEDEAKSHPQKNIITRAVGTEGSILADRFVRPFGKGDMLVLCTDGLSNLVEPAEVAKALEEDPETACDKLVDLANQRGGQDNITILILADTQ